MVKLDQTRYISRLLYNIRVNERKTEKWYSVWKMGPNHQFSCPVILTKQWPFWFCVFSLFWCTKKNYRWLFCDKNKQNDHIQNQTWDVLFISVFLQHFFHSMFSSFICIRWRTNGVWVKLHLIKQMIQAMKQRLILISIDMWQYHKSTFMYIH